MLKCSVQWIAWATLCFAIGCGDSTAPPSPIGTYDLTRVNGLAVPAPIATGLPDVTATVTGGTLSLSDRREWLAEVSLTVTSQGVTVPSNQVHSGTYRVSRDTVYFREFSDSAEEAGLFAGLKLIVTEDGVTYEFTRK